MIELYGQCEEYISTIKGEHLDEVDGTSLYECRIDLKKLQSEVLLKVILIYSLILLTTYHNIISKFQFCKVKDMTSLWIYGINAVTKLIPSSVPSKLSPSGLISSNLMNPLLSSLLLERMKGDDKAMKAQAQSSNNFEQLVEIKLKEAEERIMKKIDERIARIEAKFEKNSLEIIALLKELTNK